MIRGVIFDVGGVLAYDVWEHLLCDPPGDGPPSVAAKYHVPVNELERIGEDLWRAFDRVQGDPGLLEADYWRQFLERSHGIPGLARVEVKDLVEMTDGFIRPVDEDETARLLDWLRGEGLLLGICSNNNEFWSIRQIRKLELHKYFAPSRVVLSCHHGITKSDRRLFQIAADALGVQSAECVFVDDRMGNVSRSIDCGMVGVLFPTEHSPARPQSGSTYLRRLLGEILKGRST